MPAAKNHKYWGDKLHNRAYFLYISTILVRWQEAGRKIQLIFQSR